MAHEPYLGARDAAERLGVTVPTLYAYVSRGLLASEPAPGEPRARRYRRDQVEALRRRRELRRHPEEAAPRALAWGEPVLESSLTLVAEGRLFYRGRDVVALARHLTLEETAALLWSGAETAAVPLFAAAPPPPGLAGWLRGAAALPPVERLQAVLPWAAAADPAAWDLRPEAVTRCGARILRVAAAAIAGFPNPAAGRRRAPAAPPAPSQWSPGATAAALAAAWCRGSRRAARALDAALVLCADHELNVSTFAARCAASAAATPWEAVAAGLATLRGRRHGGASLRAESLLAEATASSAATVLRDRLRRGEELPGFGHPLYPTGDPRGAELLALAARLGPRGRRVRVAGELVAAARELVGEAPNLDLGLAALAAALRLPPGSPIAIFALGRTVGWVAHAAEEYARGRLIRPRARYIGPPPEAG